MRHSAEWQVLLDDRILEILEEEDRALSPKDIHDILEIEFSQAYIGRRFSRLAEARLVSKVHPDRALYVIDERGRAYLDEYYNVNAGLYLDESDGDIGETGKSSGE